MEEGKKGRDQLMRRSLKTDDGVIVELGWGEEEKWVYEAEGEERNKPPGSPKPLERLREQREDLVKHVRRLTDSSESQTRPTSDKAVKNRFLPFFALSPAR